MNGTSRTRCLPILNDCSVTVAPNWWPALTCGPCRRRVRHGLPVGVCIGVILAAEIVAEIENGPTPAYATEYDRVNTLLQRLADEGAAFLAKPWLPRVSHSGRPSPSWTLQTWPLLCRTRPWPRGLAWAGSASARSW